MNRQMDENINRGQMSERQSDVEKWVKGSIGWMSDWMGREIENVGI